MSLFLILVDFGITSYADDNTILGTGESIEDLISSLQESFFDNEMKGNTGICHFILSPNDSSKSQV